MSILNMAHSLTAHTQPFNVATHTHIKEMQAASAHSAAFHAPVPTYTPTSEGINMATPGDARKRTCIRTQARKHDTVYSGFRLNESPRNLSLLSGTLSLRNPFCCEEHVALWLYDCLIQ